MLALMSPTPRSGAPQSPTPDRQPSLPRPWLFLWGTGGVVLLLAQALARLGPIAWEPIENGTLSANQMVLYGVWVVVNAYLEGYRGFQKKFVPRVLARAHYLALHPSWGRGLLAPLYSMAFFAARRRALVAAWMITAFVVAAIVIIRNLSQPWRGIIDGGVVVGLGWGTVHLLVGMFQRLAGTPPPGDPDLSPGRRTNSATGDQPGERAPLGRYADSA